MRLPALALFALASATTALAGGSTSPPTATEKVSSGGFVFSILPKSLQREPRVDLNVITEMTAEGRKHPAATPEHPIYYVAQPGGYVKLGQSTVANEKPPPLADLERVMTKALLAANLQPAEPPQHPPTIALIYTWGSHTSPTEDEFTALNELAAAQAAVDSGNSPTVPYASANFAIDQLPRALADQAVRRDLIERAMLVGGGKFAIEFAKVLNDEAREAGSRPPGAVNDSATGASIPNISGDFPAGVDPSTPFGRFYGRDDRTAHLIEESFSSFYFVIATALDYQALAKGERKILWRTKMTVNSLGVAMKETIPALIVSAGQFMGKDMNEAETITRKVLRGGKVEVGTPTVREYLEPPPTPTAPAPAKDAKKR